MILAKRFEGHPGHGKVRSREYAIEEGNSGHELNRTSELVLCLRPGQKIDISMVFSEGSTNNNTCPRCQTEASGSTESRTQCQNPSCRMWFQRIVEVGEQVTVPDSLKQVKTSDIPSRSRGRTTPSNGSQSVPAGPVLHPREFQRVRLMRKHYADRCVGCKQNIANSISLTSCSSCSSKYHAHCADLNRLVQGLATWVCVPCSTKQALQSLKSKAEILDNTNAELKFRRDLANALENWALLETEYLEKLLVKGEGLNAGSPRFDMLRKTVSQFEFEMERLNSRESAPISNFRGPRSC